MAAIFPLSAMEDSSSKAVGEDLSRIKPGDLTRLAAALAASPKIRLFVDGTPGWGHQEASFMVINRLVHLYNYTGQIEVVYNPGEADDPTLPKVTKLIGQSAFKAQFTAPVLYGKVSEDALLGFAGAADGDEAHDPNYAADLKVEYFLRLQPYRWPRPNQIQRRNGTVIALDHVAHLAERAYYMPLTPLSPADWERLVSTAADPGEALRIQMVNTMVLAATHIRLYPCYGIRDDGALIDPSGNPYPSEWLFMKLAASVCEANKTKAGATVIICAEGLSPAAFNRFKQLQDVNGTNRGYTAVEVRDGFPDWQTKQRLEETRIAAMTGPGADRRKAADRESLAKFVAEAQAAEQRTAALRALAVDRRVTLCDYKSFNAESFSKHLAGMDPTDVVVLSLGRIPSAAFAALLASATVSLFEGQGTAGVALNTGRAFLHLPGFWSGGRNTLPSACLQSTDASLAAAAIFACAQELLNVARPFGESAARLSQFLVKVLSGSADVMDYYQRVQNYYTKPYNDKLLVGLVQLDAGLPVAEVAPGEVAAALLEAPTLTATGGPLDQLWQSLNSHLQSGTLHLFPDAISGDRIARFYLLALGVTTWALSQAKLSKTDGASGITAITATGQGQALGLPYDVTLTFTEENGQIRSNGQLASNVSWQLDGAPWIGLANAGFTFAVSDDNQLVCGSMFGTLPNTGVQVRMDFPIDQQVLLAWSLDKPVTVLTPFFALAGGVNLVASLPPAVAALNGIGMTGGQVLYDPQAKAVESIQFALQTDAWQLLDKLRLDGITANVVVYSPADSSRHVGVDVSGAFTIGNGADAGVIRLSGSMPQFKLSGGLSQGVIKLNDLLALFLPGVPLTLPSLPQITGFGFSYDPASRNYSLECDLNIKWPITAGPVTLEIDDVGFAVYGTPAGPSGNLFGQFAVGPSSGTGDPVVLLLTAEYQSDSDGWVFSGKQVSGTIKVMDLVSRFLQWQTDLTVNITGIGVSVAPATKAYSVTGQTEIAWSPAPLQGVSFVAGLTLSRDAAGNTSGQLSGEVKYHGIDLLFGYNFAQQQKTYFLQWGSQVRADLTYAPPSGAKDPHWIATVKLSNLTLGGLIEHMVSWATGEQYGLSAPWNALNDVNLDGVQLQFDLTARSVTIDFPLHFDLGPIGSLSGINVTYNGGDGSVMVTPTGNFPWWTSDQPKQWNATDPGSAPAPPGGGNKYVDLKFLSMGQHVSVKGNDQIESVEKAFETLEKQAQPQGDEVPVGVQNPDAPDGTPYYDRATSWLIAADIGILPVKDDKPSSAGAGSASAASPTYFLLLQAIFSDPSLYALRVKLDGPAAKVFKGLDFQILYKRISDSLGVYQAEVKLPDSVRQFDVGAFSVTLPIIAVAVYTNGDFKVDIGFPWNQDFSRSFTVQGIVAPGIPVLGSGGIYFGKLSSATSNQVPQAPDKGQFNPVIIFGIGLQVGVGKSIDKGILRAGFSITVLGILEGVIARWNPNSSAVPAAGGSETQLQGQYYFWLQGTVGIVGKLYGAIDFVIIKAAVDVTVSLLAQITYESYQPIPITVIASVDVGVTVSIDLGLFSIHLHFSFSASLKETFTIQNPQKAQDAPWYEPSQVPARQAKLLRTLRAVRPLMLLSAANPSPSWQNLLPAASPATLYAYTLPVLTVSGDFAGGTPQPYYVLLMMLESADPSQLQKADSTDTSFEVLAKQVLRWVTAAFLCTVPKTADQVDALPVTDDNLGEILHALALGSGTPPIPVKDIYTFLGGQFRFSVNDPSHTKQPDTAFFPMVPDLQLQVPPYPGIEGTAYKFSEFTSLGAEYLTLLSTYFKDLDAATQPNQTGAKLRASIAPTHSMAEFVFADYFLLLARQMVQAARDALRHFQFPINPTQKVSDVVTWAQAAGSANFTAAELFEANPAHPLAGGVSLHVVGVTTTLPAGQSCADVAGRYSKLPHMAPITGADLAMANLSSPNLLIPGSEIAISGVGNYQVQASDTLQSVANALKVGADQVAKAVAGRNDLFRPFAQLTLPAMQYSTATDAPPDTLAALAERFAVPIAALAAGNDGAAGLFTTAGAPESAYLNLPHLEQLPVAELLAAVTRTGAIRQISGMATRYFLHGLRLPTQHVTAPYIKNLPPEAGLFALTGQQFAIPAQIDAKQPFTFFLNNPTALTWVELGGSKEGQS